MATLRKKTTERLDENLCKYLSNAVDQMLHSQNTFTEAEAIIWHLTYNYEDALDELGFISSTVTKDEASIIRAELANQFRMVHSEWDYGTEKPWDEVTQKLWKALGGDQYAYHTVMKKLRDVDYLYVEGMLKVNRCLNSPVESSQFGGLRELGFSPKEAEFLKPAANQMGEVFFNIWETYLKRYQEEQNQTATAKPAQGQYSAKRTNATLKQEKAEEPSTLSEEKKHAKVDLMKLIADREQIIMLYQIADEIDAFPEKDWLIADRKKIMEFYATVDKIEQFAEKDWLIAHREKIEDFFQSVDALKG